MMGSQKKLSCVCCKKNGIFLPYLGSNDHPADITNVEIFKGEIADEDEISQIDSFFPDSLVELDKDEDEIIPFQYAEFLPVGLDKQTHMYQYEKFVFTNIPILCHQAEVVCTKSKKYHIFLTYQGSSLLLSRKGESGGELAPVRWGASAIWQVATAA